MASENVRVLRNLGLSRQEAAGYLALLRLGGSGAATLAKEMSVKRTTVYAILKSLTEHGAAEAYLKKGRIFYRPIPPEKLAERFEEKIELFRGLIPSLVTMEKEEGRLLGLRFIEAKAELERFYRDILKEYRGKSYRIIGNASAWESIDPEFFIQFRKDRATHNISTRLLLSAGSEEINPIESTLLREWRYLPPEHEFKSTIDIFDDKILIVSPELSSLAVVIATPAMTDVFKSIFDVLWSMLKG